MNRTLALALLAASALTVGAVAPSLRSTSPSGVQRGTEAELKFDGARLGDAEEILLYEPGVKVLELKEVKDSYVLARVKLDADCPLGEHKVRVRTKTGISDFRTFIVGPFPQVEEKEPNNTLEKAQKIPLNSTVLGTVSNEDVDYYAVELKKGEPLAVEVEGMRLGRTMFDPYVAILDRSGKVLAKADDTALFIQDTYATIIAPADGEYLIEVRETSYGGAGNPYRVHIGSFPRPSAVFPPGGKAGESLEVKFLGDAGLTYTGVLEPPKGKTVDDWEPRPQLLFKATEFGDEVDRPLKKSDGSWTYFAADIAYHKDKVDRGFKNLVNIWGADHGGYVARMTAAVKAVGGGKTKFEAVLCQIVHIMRGGEPVRMSKRAGTYVTLADLIEEVGKDAVRFTMLTRSADAQMEFDLDKVVAQTRDNPVFYVQYAHARCRSVLRSATELYGAATVSDAALAEVSTAALTAEAELAVLKRLAQWSRVVEGAALSREPHRIAFFLYDLASDFHMLWNRGREDTTLRFIQEDRREDTLARLALVAATAATIRSGLATMGVTPVEEMR